MAAGQGGHGLPLVGEASQRMGEGSRGKRRVVASFLGLVYGVTYLGYTPVRFVRFVRFNLCIPVYWPALSEDSVTASVEQT